jgi:hypothetical protein
MIMQGTNFLVPMSNFSDQILAVNLPREDALTQTLDKVCSYLAEQPKQTKVISSADYDSSKQLQNLFDAAT